MILRFELTGIPGVLALAAFLVVSPVWTVAQTAPIGSLSASGSVRLRGIELIDDGTLFSGDEIETGDLAYVRVSLVGGQNIELGDRTRVDVETTVSHLQIGMHSGSMAFAAPESSAELRIEVPAYEIRAPRGSAGDITFVEGDRVGVRALEGPVLIRSAGMLVEVREGGSRLLQLAGPQGPPQPAEPVPGGTALGSVADTVIWTTVVGIVSGVAVYQIFGRGESASPSTPE